MFANKYNLFLLIYVHLCSFPNHSLICLSINKILPLLGTNQAPYVNQSSAAFSLVNTLILIQYKYSCNIIIFTQSYNKPYTYTLHLYLLILLQLLYYILQLDLPIKQFNYTFIFTFICYCLFKMFSSWLRESVTGLYL